MEKILMNDLDKVNDIAYLCGVDASGNPVLISKASLGSVVAPSVTATKGEVWIVYLDSNKNKILVPWEQWTTSRTDAVGVAIMSGGRRLLIAPHESSLYWSSVAGSGGAVTTTVKTTADVDYAGQSNTSKIVASAAFAGDGEGYAPGYCAAYSNGGVTAGSWWLPSLGELGMIYEKYDAINAALKKSAELRSCQELPTGALPSTRLRARGFCISVAAIAGAILRRRASFGLGRLQHSNSLTL